MMLVLRGSRLRPHRFAGTASNGLDIAIAMPTTLIFGRSDGSLAVGSEEYEIRSEHNKLWLLNPVGQEVAFAELRGLETIVLLGSNEFTIKRPNVSTAVARIVHDGIAIGAVTGGGKGDRKVVVDVDRMTNPVHEAFIACATIAGWRDLASSMSISTEGQARGSHGYTPTGVDGGGGVSGGDVRDSDKDSGGGFWSGFDGDVGGGGGGGGD